MAAHPIAPATFHRMLPAVAAHGLAGTLLEMPTSPLSDAEFLHLHAGVRDHKLSGHFWAAIRDGFLPVTPWQRERALDGHTRALAGVLQLEDLLLASVGSLREAGVNVRVLKGAALSHLDYPELGVRTYGDLDLLVQGSCFDAAVDALSGAGVRRRFPPPRPGFDQRFGKGACLVTASGLEIDLHRSLAIGPFGERLDLDTLWGTGEHFEVASVDLEALPLEARVLHACYHCVLGDRWTRLTPLRDVAQLLLTKPVDWARLQRLIDVNEAHAVVATAVDRAWRLLGIADVLRISAWAAGYRPPPRTLSDLAAYRPGSTYAARSVATVRAIPTYPEKAQYVATMVWPARSYLGDRHTGYSARLRRAVFEYRQLKELE
jgi:hypothetical protein